MGPVISIWLDLRVENLTLLYTHQMNMVNHVNHVNMGNKPILGITIMARPSMPYY